MNNKTFRQILVSVCVLAVMALCMAGIFGAHRSAGVSASDTTSTPTPAVSPTNTVSPTVTSNPTLTPTVSVTPSPSVTVSPSLTPTVTVSPSPTATPTPTSTVTPTPSVTQKPTATPTPTPVPDGPSADAKITAITANYLGENVLVGEEFNTEDLTVYVLYSDYYSEEITDYTCSSKVVSEEGLNEFVAMAYGLTAKFYVYGKTVTSISASCSRYNFTVGNAPDTLDINVKATYSDFTTETIDEGFTISPAVFTETGTQDVTITYKGRSATVSVLVKEAPELKQLNVYYRPEAAYTKTPINRNDLSVNAVYTDNSSERITTYELVTKEFLNAGEQKLTVSYRDKQQTISVLVRELEIKSIRGKYVGEDVYIGSEYDPRYLYVYATYNNGTEQRIDDYTVYNKIIRYIGDNTIKVYKGDFSTSVTIIGCEIGEPDFTYVSKSSVTSNGYDITIDTAIPKILEDGVTEVKKMSKAKLKHLYRILGTKTEYYLGFTYGFFDNNHEKYLPMTIRLTLPDGFKPEYTELYYSPNNKTILGCMNKMAVDDNVLQITVFKVGTYMLVYDPDKYIEEEIPEDEEEEEDED
ncbi:MAG: bacterial Ig-like domain-containing protein [Lachnospiraceae bacterium]|nr:bacterial Ig-like domain-containing protein [Lachnospiraceae bacterium]